MRSPKLACAVLAVFAALSGVASAAPDALGAKRPAVDGSPPRVPVESPIGRLQAPAGQVAFPCQDPAAEVHCYGPDQIRTAYAIQPLLDRGIDGRGRTIVIIDAFQSPTVRQDLAVFDRQWNLPDPTLGIVAPDGLTPFDAGDPNQVGWATEITLDVEWAHAIAPGAAIALVLAKSPEDPDILSATRYAVRHHLGDVISQSFGEAEQCAAPKIITAEHAVFADATSRGITLFAASGDLGAQESCDGSPALNKAVSTPASDPLVTGVGGTTLYANYTSGAYGRETVWNEFDTFGAAAGGGFSSLFRRPFYQALANSRPTRGVPDVAYDAAMDNGVLGYFGVPGQAGWYIFGGTSAGSPQWAGIVALAVQLNRGALGLLNPVLYGLGVDGVASRFFHDITAGNSDFPPIRGYTARRGWDPASGLGSPIAASLVPALAVAR